MDPEPADARGKSCRWGRLGLRVLCCVLLLDAFAVIGCGAPATTVTGVVTLDGQAIDGASIQFFPTTGKGQPSGTTTDSSGRYRATVSPFPQRVVIRKREVTGYLEDTKDRVDGGSPIVQERIPALYTDVATTPLTAEPVQHATTTVDFAITSPAAAKK